MTINYSSIPWIRVGCALLTVTEDQIKAVMADLGMDLSSKEKQLYAIKAIVSEKNVMCVLPTGYGKIMVYAMPPLVMDKVRSVLIFWVQDRQIKNWVETFF